MGNRVDQRGLESRHHHAQDHAAALPRGLHTWKLQEPAPAAVVDCSQRCSQWGWKYARRPCEAPPALREGAGGFRGFSARWNGSICKFDPSEIWRCCFLRAPEDK